MNFTALFFCKSFFKKNCIFYCNFSLGFVIGERLNQKERNDSLSISGEISRIERNISNAFSACAGKGAILPQTQNSANLSSVINSIPAQKITRYEQRNSWVARYLDEVRYLSEDSAAFTPPFSGDDTVVWDFGDTAVASVSVIGVTATIRGVSEGYSVITATVGSDSYSIRADVAETDDGIYLSCVKGYHAQHEYGNWNPQSAVINTNAGLLKVLDGDNGGIIEKTAITGENTVANLTPGRTAAYTVMSDGAMIDSGQLLPEGACRMIRTENMENIRDIGGWMCDGGTVRYNQIIRGYTLYYASAADKRMLLGLLRIRQDVSLQYPTDSNYYEPSLLGDAVDFVRYDGDLWYSGILQNDNAGKLFKDIFQAAVDGKAQYIHCAQGADRTGTVMYLIESVLGMSESDKDKEYELTSYTAQRLRSGTDWIGLKNAVAELSGSTVRDKVVGWLVTKGVPIELINAFRTAMIDGTPEVLTADVAVYTVTKNGSGVTYDNPAATIKQYQEYCTAIVPDSGKVIEQVTVTLNGVDISANAVSGDLLPFGEKSVTANGTYDISGFASVNVQVPSSAPTKYSVTKTLSDASTNNPLTQVISGEGYAATITPLTDYVIDAVRVSVNGADVTSDYVFLFEEVS